MQLALSQQSGQLHEPLVQIVGVRQSATGLSFGTSSSSTAMSGAANNRSSNVSSRSPRVAADTSEHQRAAQTPAGGASASVDRTGSASAAAQRKNAKKNSVAMLECNPDVDTLDTSSLVVLMPANRKQHRAALASSTGESLSELNYMKIIDNLTSRYSLPPTSARGQPTNVHAGAIPVAGKSKLTSNMSSMLNAMPSTPQPTTLALHQQSSTPPTHRSTQQQQQQQQQVQKHHHHHQQHPSSSSDINDSVATASTLVFKKLNSKQVKETLSSRSDTIANLSLLTTHQHVHSSFKSANTNNNKKRSRSSHVANNTKNNNNNNFTNKINSKDYLNSITNQQQKAPTIYSHMSQSHSLYHTSSSLHGKEFSSLTHDNKYNSSGSAPPHHPPQPLQHSKTFFPLNPTKITLYSEFIAASESNGSGRNPMFNEMASSLSFSLNNASTASHGKFASSSQNSHMSLKRSITRISAKKTPTATATTKAHTTLSASPKHMSFNPTNGVHLSVPNLSFLQLVKPIHSSKHDLAANKATTSAHNSLSNLFDMTASFSFAPPPTIFNK